MSGFGTFGRKKPQVQQDGTSELAIDAADIARQQSAYTASLDLEPQAKKQSRQQPTPKVEKKATVVRAGGGKTWEDKTLLEWNPDHFRLFVGNIANEVGDDQLHRAFASFGSIAKARVIRDRKTGKSKGFGFVAFKSSDDYLRAFREMNGKYIGSHPITLKRADSEIKPSIVVKKADARHKPYQKHRPR